MKRAETSVGGGAPIREWALTGPSLSPPGDMPVRGDLAHIRMAGLHFVPHYAEPMPHVAAGSGAVVRAAPRGDADARTRLEPGARFAVLDIAGSWAWGQVEDGAEAKDGENGAGPVGYVILEELEQASS